MKLTPTLLALACFLPPFAHAAEEKEAKVAGSAGEAQLATITLTESAEKRLGITTVAIEKKPMKRDRLYGGEIVLPLPPGSDAENAQSVFPLLSEMTASDKLRMAEAQIDADGAVAAANVQLEAAEQIVRRAQQLLADKAGSEKAVEEAESAHNLAQQALASAEARRTLLGPPVLPIAAPDTVWIKVPVHVGALETLDLAADATVIPLHGRAGSATRAAKPVTAPQSASAATATVDLFYEADNATAPYRLGQRVGLRLPLSDEAESLVLPWSAVLYDINGGTWVYARTAPLVYSRMRIEVRRIEGNLAVLARGPAPGTEVVTAGAAELFGTEFGGQK
jgi:hypothetical protein